MGIITLTTDFGEKDFYLGQMKGVILGLNENVGIVDITHEISAHNILQGAFIFSQIWKYFPKGTIHLGVVDPGVGSSRKGIIIETSWCFFIGPDNGLFSLAVREQKIKKIIEIDGKKVKEISGLEISRTFHGRDIFAPVAALLGKGHKAEEFGKEIRQLKKLKLKENEVIYIDHFGNLVASISKKFREGQGVILKHRNKKIKARMVRTFSEGNLGEFLLLRGSHGFLELDLKEESAAKKLKAEVGDKIMVLQE